MHLTRKAAAGMVLVALIAGCGGSDADTTEDEGLPTTPLETPSGELLDTTDTGNPFEDREPVVTNEPAEPSGEINESAPAPESETAIQLVANYSAQGQQGWYYSEDSLELCRYYTATDGNWYADLCLKHAVDQAGNPVSNLLNLWQYNADSGWQVILNLWTGYPDFVVYRDLTDPVFNDVSWVAYPVGQYPTENNTYVMQAGDNSWYTIAYMKALLYGNTNYPLWVPAWDPSVAVWTHTTLFNVNNNIASIPSFF